IDMPPGTGDIHLTLAQSTPLDGAIIVTTPQDVATLDARKCLDMFRKVHVPVLGVVENMSYFDDPASGNRSYIFGEGGGKRLAEECSVSFLGEVPLAPSLRAAMDAGAPTDQPAYRTIAAALR
ncbi:MAG: P-loop NTPase, partial [Alphaproteobacteria bacterium]|nr:P-loop NTPase [Alphaproteobacteria bacterium]